MTMNMSSLHKDFFVLLWLFSLIYGSWKFGLQFLSFYFLNKNKLRIFVTYCRRAKMATSYGSFFECCHFFNFGFILLDASIFNL